MTGVVVVVVGHGIVMPILLLCEREGEGERVRTAERATERGRDGE